jgi:hypothetical protein
MNPTSLLRNGVYFASIDTPFLKVANKKTLSTFFYNSYPSIAKKSINFNPLFTDYRLYSSDFSKSNFEDFSQLSLYSLHFSKEGSLRKHGINNSDQLVGHGK